MTEIQGKSILPGSSYREVRVSEGSSYRESTVLISWKHPLLYVTVSIELAT